jgi:hypothetical protein
MPNELTPPTDGHEWLKELKVGDEVAVASVRSKRVLRLEKVTAIYPSSVHTILNRYFFASGISSTGHTELWPVTPQVHDQLSENEAKYQIIEQIKQESLFDFQISTLEKIAALLEEAKTS